MTDTLNAWIKEDNKSVFDFHSGSTVLIKFNNGSNGITTDNSESVDISWMRANDKIHATTGDYLSVDIKEWKVID